MAHYHDDGEDFDDGFDDFLSDGEEEMTLQVQEMEALERKMKTVGIRDGIDFGKEDTLQEGFDAGFTVGALYSYPFSVLRGALSTAKACGLFDNLDPTAQKEVADCITKLHQQAMNTAPVVAASTTNEPTLDESTSKAAETSVTIAQEFLRQVSLVVNLTPPTAKTEKKNDQGK